MDKTYEKPIFQHKIQLNKALDQVKVELLNLRHLGYQVETRRNIYDEELFKITGFAGTAFEIDGVVETLDEERVQISYNTHIDTLILSRRQKLQITMSLFVYAGLCTFVQTLGLNYSLSQLMAIIALVAWLLVLRSLFLLLRRDPYLADNKKAQQGMLKLEADFLDSMKSEFTIKEQEQLRFRQRIEREDSSE